MRLSRQCLHVLATERSISMLKKLLGLAPQQESDGSYYPSKLALMLSTSDKSNYEPIAYNPISGSRTKILLIATEQKNMTMLNGKLFSTGNHPAEALVPMLHLKNAGYEFHIATPNGKPTIFEMWAFPREDEHVNDIYVEYKDRFEKPMNLKKLVDDGLNTDDYDAIFIPGGHGAMLGLPDEKCVSSVLKWAQEHNVFTITLCHGPGALLSTLIGDHHFLYKGYKTAVFPDSVDAFTPFIGYLPGKMPWGLSEKLKELGMTLANSKADNTVCRDRLLITGASPLAANALGKLAAETLIAARK